jgi:hypothetical protein
MHLRSFRLVKIPRCGLRMSGRAHVRAERHPIKMQREYRPKINRPVRAQ